jgi:hypothetical protein
MEHGSVTIEAGLARECRIFTEYLTGREPTAYVQEKYECGHQSLPRGRPDRFDASLMKLARRGGLALAVSDAYTQFFRPTGVLRQKLVLLLAILENSPAFHAYLNSADDAGRLSVVLRLGFRGVAFLLTLLIGIVLLGPTHLILGDRAPVSQPGAEGG